MLKTSFRSIPYVFLWLPPCRLYCTYPLCAWALAWASSSRRPLHPAIFREQNKYSDLFLHMYVCYSNKSVSLCTMAWKPIKWNWFVIWDIWVIEGTSKLAPGSKNLGFWWQAYRRHAPKLVGWQCFKFTILGNYLTAFCDDDHEFPLSNELDEKSCCGDEKLRSGDEKSCCRELMSINLVPE